jgi:hypothetical protein
VTGAGVAAPQRQRPETEIADGALILFRIPAATGIFSQQTSGIQNLPAEAVWQR